MAKTITEYLVENASRFFKEDSDSSDTSSETVDESSNYYDTELAGQLNDEAQESLYSIKVKAYHTIGTRTITSETKWLNLNKESIEAIQKFLDKVESKVDKEIKDDDERYLETGEPNKDDEDVLSGN